MNLSRESSENPEVTTQIMLSYEPNSRVENLLPKLKLKPAMPYSGLPVLPVWLMRRCVFFRPPTACRGQNSCEHPSSHPPSHQSEVWHRPVRSSQSPFEFSWVCVQGSDKQGRQRNMRAGLVPRLQLSMSWVKSIMFFPLTSEIKMLLFFLREGKEKKNWYDKVHVGLLFLHFQHKF